MIIKGRQGTWVLDVWYSRITVFSLIEVLLNFLKYLLRVLFHRMVVSALIGLVLYLCQDFNCLMTRSRFQYFCNNWSVIFSVIGRNLFSISTFDRGIVSIGSLRLKTWLIVYLNHHLVGLIKLFY